MEYTVILSKCYYNATLSPNTYEWILNSLPTNNLLLCTCSTSCINTYFSLHVDIFYPIASYHAVFGVLYFLCIVCTILLFNGISDAAPVSVDDVLMKNISDLHFQLFSSIKKKTKMMKVKKSVSKLYLV